MNGNGKVSSLVTGGVSITVASLVPLIQWMINGFARPVPDQVVFLIAAGVLPLIHLAGNLINDWAVKQKLEPPSPPTPGATP
jgi:hypothetical protein